ncbi:MAG: hypothetical protein ACRDD2_13185 [Sarcina sp.]
MLEKATYSIIEKMTIANIKEEFAIEEKKKKKELVEMAKARVTNNEVFIRKIYKKYNKLIAIHPAEVENLFSITKSQRKKLQEAQLFKISYYEDIRLYGKDLQVPMFDYISVHSTSIETVIKILEEYKTKSKINKVKGLEKSKETKIKNKKIVDEYFSKELKEIKSNWNFTTLQEEAILDLAFWTVWLSRIAKTFQEKHKRARTDVKIKEHLSNKEKFYNYKREALLLLSKFENCRISFYRPEFPHKEEIFFCEEHFSLFKVMRENNYHFDKWDFLDINKKMISKCPNCKYTKEKDFYSLYYLEIGNDNCIFSFHLPYSLGKDSFPNPSKLEKVSHVEQYDSYFRFGRSLTSKEKVIFKEQIVEENFLEAFEKLRRYTLLSIELNRGRENGNS